MGNWYCVTGGSSGLGFALVEELLSEGNSCISISRTISSRMIESEIIESSKRKGLYYGYKCDISNPKIVSDTFNDIKNKVGQLDSIIHCAGIHGPIGPITNLDFSDWKQALDINLSGTFNILKSAILTFGDQQSGFRFIGLSGGGATSPMPRSLAYAASKSGQVRLIESVAKDLEKTNIKLFSVAPGIMKTKMLEEVLANKPSLVGEEYYSRIKSASDGPEDSTKMAIELIKFICEGKLDSATGRLISAVWDDWRNLNEVLLNVDEDFMRLRRNID